MKRIQLVTVAFALFAMSIASGANSPQEKKDVKGSLVIMGGAIHPDTEDIWQRIVVLAGGKGASIAVIAAAAGSPESSAKRTIEILSRYGAEAFFVPAAPRLANRDFRKDADDAAIAAQVAKAGGVFFNGGDQSRITQTLVRADGSQTALLKAIQDVHARGGVLAGTSAGAAIMSRTMFYEPPDVLRVLQNGVKAGTDIAQGLGFIGDDVFVDQHVLARGRFARMLPAMLAAKVTLGVGVDENTAVLVDANKQMEVLGASGVIIIDTARGTCDARNATFNMKGVRLSYLERGDRFDLRTQALTLSPFKAAGSVLNHQSRDFKPEFDDPRWYADALGKNMLIEIVTNLVDNSQKETIGLALPSPNHTNRTLGFEFTFRKGDNTRGFLRIEKGRAHYSVRDVELDVRPISVSNPLYR
jgi:cyanophycinase